MDLILNKYTTLLEQAWKDALQAQVDFDHALEVDLPSAWRFLQDPNPRERAHAVPVHRRVGVIGHRYIFLDNTLNHNLFEILANNRVEAVHVETVPAAKRASLANRLAKRVYWELGKDLVTAGMHFAESPGIDGVINMANIGCGQNSFTSKLVEHYFTRDSDKPFFSLVIDEHSADAGLNTRLEAFVDMIERRKRGVSNRSQVEGLRHVQRSSPTVSPNPFGITYRRHVTAQCT